MKLEDEERSEIDFILKQGAVDIKRILENKIKRYPTEDIKENSGTEQSYFNKDRSLKRMI